MAADRWHHPPQAALRMIAAMFLTRNRLIDRQLPISLTLRDWV